jgi:cell division protein FtsN
MATFNFGKQNPEDEGIPPEPIEGETEVRVVSESDGEGSRMRRPLLFALIGLVLIGGVYLANILFFSTPPPPPIPSRPTVPVPTSSAPAPPATKEASPAPLKAAPSKPEVKAEGKESAQTPPVSTKTAEPVKPAAPVKVMPEATAPTKPVTPAKPSAEPVAPAKPMAPIAKAEIKPPAKSGSAASKGFSVQLGAMAQQENAESLKRRLDAGGYQAIVRKGSGFASSHRVTVSEPTGKPEAEEMARRLNVDGFPSQLVPVEGKFAPQVGSFVNLDEAIDLARELQKRNYRPKITSKPATTVLFQVRHGQFDTRAAAMKRGEELRAKGFNAWVVPN